MRFHFIYAGALSMGISAAVNFYQGNSISSAIQIVGMWVVLAIIAKMGD